MKWSIDWPDCRNWRKRKWAWPCSLFGSRATPWGSRRAIRRQTASVTWSKRTGPVRKHNTQTENRGRRWPREHIEMWYWSRAWNRTVCTGLKQRESIATNAAFHNYFYHLTSSDHVQLYRNTTKSLIVSPYCDWSFPNYIHSYDTHLTSSESFTCANFSCQAAFVKDVRGNCRVILKCCLSRGDFSDQMQIGLKTNTRCLNVTLMFPVRRNYTFCLILQNVISRTVTLVKLGIASCWLPYRGARCQSVEWERIVFTSG